MRSGSMRIEPQKGNPSIANLLPGPTPGDLEVILDRFDRYGCKSTCVKKFNVIRNPVLELREGNISTTRAFFSQNRLNVFQPAGSTITAIQLLDIGGRILQSWKGPGSYNQSIHSEYLTPGIYLVRLNMDTENLTQKVLIQ
jgi:hypothetical protein